MRVRPTSWRRVGFRFALHGAIEPDARAAEFTIERGAMLKAAFASGNALPVVGNDHVLSQATYLRKPYDDLAIDAAIRTAIRSGPPKS